MWGIERDPKATAVALERMDRVIVADFTDGAELAKELGDARFDVIMFSDVLEHTVDPGGVLSGFLDYLSDDGRIVVSVPNVANWVTRFGLLFGRFTYTATGVLDRTHLRFFTRRSAIELVRGCGLEVRPWTSLRCWCAPPPPGEERVVGDQTSTDVQVISDSRLYRLYARLVLPLERAIVRIAPGLLAFQVVIVATRPGGGQ